MEGKSVGVCRWCGKAIEYAHGTWWETGTAMKRCRSSPTMDRGGWSVHEPSWIPDLPDLSDLDDIDRWLRS